MTTSLLDRWPALRDLSDGLSPGRWAATFFAVALGQFVFWVALLHLLVGDRERVERLMYFTGFTVLPLASILITFGGAWLAQRRERALTAFSDGLIAFNLGLALVAGLLARGEFFNPSPDSLPIDALRELAALHALPWQVDALAQTLHQTAAGLPLLVLLVLGLGHGLLLAAVGLARVRLAQAALLLLANLLLVLATYPTWQAVQALAVPTPTQIRLDQAQGPQVSFDWQMDGGCIDYAFSAAGAQAIWLGEIGLASVDPVNYGRLCAALPQTLRVIIDDGRESLYLVGGLQTDFGRGWGAALLVALLVPPLILWGGLRAALLLALASLGALFLGAFTPAGLDAWPALLAGGGAALLALLPWRGGRWFDLAFGLLIVGLCVNLGFPYDQFHYHSGWLGTVSAMQHGQTLMVDVFSQRGFLSMATLAGFFTVLPLSYPMFSLLISSLLAAQFITVYGLLKWAEVGRWWAACAVLLGIALYTYKLYFHMVSLPGFSPLRLGHVFLLALAVGWRLRTGRRAAQWAEWAVLVFCVLWSLDSAVIVLAGYGVLLAYEAWHQHGMSRAGLWWLVRRGALLAALIGGAFLASSLWLWLSTGQVPRWDIYLAFFRYHDDLQGYQRAIPFWGEGWWLSIVPQFAALLVLAWRALTGQSAASWRREAAFGLLAVGGVAQFYHYVTQSVYPNNHIVPAAVALVYLAYLLESLLARPASRRVVRMLALGVLGVLGWQAAQAAESSRNLHLPLALALPQIAAEGLRGEVATWAWIEARWTAFERGDYQPGRRKSLIAHVRVQETRDLIQRYSPQQPEIGLFMDHDDALYTLLLLGRRQAYPRLTFAPHDTRVPALVALILDAPQPFLAGDVVYAVADPYPHQPDPRNTREEAQPLMPILLDRLCRQFDFELLEASEHGVLAIRLQPSRGENAICETHRLFLPSIPNPSPTRREGIKRPLALWERTLQLRTEGWVRRWRHDDPLSP